MYIYNHIHISIYIYVFNSSHPNLLLPHFPIQKKTKTPKTPNMSQGTGVSEPRIRAFLDLTPMDVDAGVQTLHLFGAQGATDMNETSRLCPIHGPIHP